MRRIIRIVTILCLALCGACSRGQPADAANTDKSGEKDMKKNSPRVVRRALGSGRWFPGDPVELRDMVEGYIDAAELPALDERIVGGIAPHAGYIYSGKVAGYTYAALQRMAQAKNPPETVVVLGFSHRGMFRGVALMDGDALATPLGEAVLDQEAGNRLAEESDRIFFDYRPHAGEHSAENQVPFVQVALPDARLVMALIGDHDTGTLDALVQALLKLTKQKRIVVVASTDLLHDPDYDRVVKSDKKTLETIVALDDAGLSDRWSPAHQPCCGIGPVLTVMKYARELGCEKGHLLHYRNSGDYFPESRGQYVVGYGSVVFTVP